MRKMQIDEQFPYVCPFNVNGKEFKVHCNVEINFLEFSENEPGQIYAITFVFPSMHGFFVNQPLDVENTQIGRILRKNAAGNVEVIPIFADNQILSVEQNLENLPNTFQIDFSVIENGDDIYIVIIPTALVYVI